MAAGSSSTALVPSASKSAAKAGAGAGAAAKGAEAEEAVEEEPTIDIRLAYNLEWSKRRDQACCQCTVVVEHYAHQVAEAKTKLEGLLAAAADAPAAPEVTHSVQRRMRFGRAGGRGRSTGRSYQGTAACPFSCVGCGAAQALG